jgi:hypothetical protein
MGFLVWLNDFNLIFYVGIFGLFVIVCLLGCNALWIYRYIGTSVLEEHTASIFKAEEDQH